MLIEAEIDFKKRQEMIKRKELKMQLMEENMIANLELDQEYKDQQELYWAIKSQLDEKKAEVKEVKNDIHSSKDAMSKLQFMSE